MRPKLSENRRLINNLVILAIVFGYLFGYCYPEHCFYFITQYGCW